MSKKITREDMTEFLNMEIGDLESDIQSEGTDIEDDYDPLVKKLRMLEAIYKELA